MKSHFKASFPFLLLIIMSCMGISGESNDGRKTEEIENKFAKSGKGVVVVKMMDGDTFKYIAVSATNRRMPLDIAVKDGIVFESLTELKVALSPKKFRIFIGGLGEFIPSASSDRKIADFSDQEHENLRRWLVSKECKE